MMDETPIYQKLQDILVEEFSLDAAAAQPDASFKESLDLDSLDYDDLAVIIHSNFGVKLTIADFKEIVTLQDFYTIVERKLATS